MCEFLHDMQPILTMSGARGGSRVCSFYLTPKGCNQRDRCTMPSSLLSESNVEIALLVTLKSCFCAMFFACFLSLDLTFKPSCSRENVTFVRTAYLLSPLVQMKFLLFFRCLIEKTEPNPRGESSPNKKRRIERVSALTLFVLQASFYIRRPTPFPICSPKPFTRPLTRRQTCHHLVHRARQRQPRPRVASCPNSWSTASTGLRRAAATKVGMCHVLCCFCVFACLHPCVRAYVCE